MSNTKHNDSCTMSFGRTSKHSNCPRCEELKNGATPIKWHTSKHNTTSSLSAYCFNLAIIHSHCTADTNPSCACGKMSYTD